jgi:hypothetical protein
MIIFNKYRERNIVYVKKIFSSSRDKFLNTEVYIIKIYEDRIIQHARPKDF